MGPHAYVSPTWYATGPAVPTWNYAVVHVYGVPRLLSADETRQVVDLTVRKYESGRQSPWSNDLPDDFRQRLLAGVIGYEMPLTRIEGKYKLGQNRSAADQTGMLNGLHNDGVESRLLAGFHRIHSGRCVSCRTRRCSGLAIDSGSVVNFWSRAADRHRSQRYSYSVQRYSYSKGSLMPEPTFDNERLDVDRVSIERAAFSYQIAKSLGSSN
jgi:hypothetical protein